MKRDAKHEPQEAADTAFLEGFSCPQDRAFSFRPHGNSPSMRHCWINSKRSCFYSSCVLCGHHYLYYIQNSGTCQLRNSTIIRKANGYFLVILLKRSVLPIFLRVIDPNHRTITRYHENYLIFQKRLDRKRKIWYTIVVFEIILLSHRVALGVRHRGARRGFLFFRVQIIYIYHYGGTRNE